MEKELLPVLRSNGIAFVAYNPLAGGMLTGKHSREDGEVPKGRFHKNKNYSDRFYKPDVFDAVDKINAACNKAGISIIQAGCYLVKWSLNCVGSSTNITLKHIMQNYDLLILH